MRSESHTAIAELVCRKVPSLAPARDALIHGSLAPDDEKGYPTPHHRWDKLKVDWERRRAIPSRIPRARSHFLNEDLQNAAFTLGVALHYLADDFVPYGGGDEEHSGYEASAAHHKPSSRAPADVSGHDATMALIGEAEDECQTQRQRLRTSPARAVDRAAWFAVGMAAGVGEARYSQQLDDETDRIYTQSFLECAETCNEIKWQPKRLLHDLRHFDDDAEDRNWVQQIGAFFARGWLGAKQWLAQATADMRISWVIARTGLYVAGEHRRLRGSYHNWYLLRDYTYGLSLQQIRQLHSTVTDSDAREYVCRMRNRGKSAGEIADALKDAGWTQRQIRHLFAAIQVSADDT